MVSLQEVRTRAINLKAVLRHAGFAKHPGNPLIHQRIVVYEVTQQKLGIRNGGEDARPPAYGVPVDLAGIVQTAKGDVAILFKRWRTDVRRILRRRKAEKRVRQPDRFFAEECL